MEEHNFDHTPYYTTLTNAGKSHFNRVSGKCFLITVYELKYSVLEIGVPPHYFYRVNFT